jgi:hypothetical protein
VKDLFDVGAQRRIGQRPQQQLGVAADGGEQVVEVVGDADRQPADRLHLLHVPQLLLELLALGHFAAQLVVDTAERRRALVDAAFEIAVRFVQGELAGAQLFLRVVPLGDVAQDHQDLVAFHRQEARLVEAQRRGAGAQLELDADRGVFVGQPLQRRFHGFPGAGVDGLGDRLAGLPPAGRVAVGAALDVENHAAGVEPQDLIGEGADQRAQLRVGGEQFLRAEIERALEPLAVVVELAVGVVDRLEHRRQLGRRRRIAEMAPQLPPQKTVEVAHALGFGEGGHGHRLIMQLAPRAGGERRFLRRSRNRPTPCADRRYHGRLRLLLRRAGAAPCGAPRS